MNGPQWGPHDADPKLLTIKLVARPTVICPQGWSKCGSITKPPKQLAGSRGDASFAEQIDGHFSAARRIPNAIISKYRPSMYAVSRNTP